MGLEQVFVDDHIDFEGVLYDGSSYDVTGRIVSNSPDGTVGIRGALILGFEESKQKFKAVFEDTGERRLIPRIYLCLDHENPYRWSDRFT